MAKIFDDNKKVLEKTSKDLGIPQHVIHEVVRLYFNMAREDINTAKFQNTIMMGFGKFVCKEANKEKRLRNIKSKEERDV